MSFWRLHRGREELIEKYKDPKTGEWTMKVLESRPSEFLKKREELINTIEDVRGEKARERNVAKEVEKSCEILSPILKHPYLTKECFLKVRPHKVRIIELTEKEIKLERELEEHETLGIRKFPHID